MLRRLKIVRCSSFMENRSCPSTKISPRRLCDELGKTVILVLHECAFKNGKIAKFGTVKEVIRKEVLSEIYHVDFEIMEIEGKPLSIYY